MSAEPEPPPKGVFPLFLRGVTLEKFGLKTGEGVNDVVEYKNVPKEDIMKEIQVMGVMSDFEPGKKLIDSYQGDQILIVVDRAQKYGETYLLCYTDEAKDFLLKDILEQQEAVKEQLMAEMKAEEERKAAELARLNIVYEDKPIDPRPWVSTSVQETEHEIKLLKTETNRELYSIEINRPKKFSRQSYKFTDRDSDVGGVAEFRAYKDPNFRSIKDNDMGIQVAPPCSENAAQTTFYRPINKAIQYESASIQVIENDSNNDGLLSFLDKATFRIEQALQQNESVDIFHETFRLVEEDEGQDNVQAENELRELRNFADANFSKSKALAAIDWMPKTQGMVAVSAVRNISFDQRIPILGQTHTSYVMLWDFRLLVKPLILMQSHHEIFTFRFNRTDPNYIVGGCITGQVLLWEVNESINHAQRKNNRGSGNSNNTNNTNNNGIDDDFDEMFANGNNATHNIVSVQPKYASSVDHSHKKAVADMFWLPPTTQINYRGQLVSDEHLDGHSYQFVTIAGDGLIMVWDIRFEQIFNDELRHIARPKHIPTEKLSNKDNAANANATSTSAGAGTNQQNAGLRPLWAPIFKTHLKRLEGVGELSLCKVCETMNTKQVINNASVLTVGKASTFSGDSRTQFIVATEEGDIIFADLSTRKVESQSKKEDEEEDEENEVSCVKWLTMDHPRPSVHLQESPFFPQIVLSISDWNFHIWKLGENRPLFVSPLSNSYLTAGCWSNTRPAVLYVACADGQILVWDFTDSSFRPSIELKATHSKITSLELLNSNMQSSRLQMMAVGDESGTLHIFEMPRNLIKPVHKEEYVMQKFLERELQRNDLAEEMHQNAELPGSPHKSSTADGHDHGHGHGAPPGTAGHDVRASTAGDDNFGSVPATAGTNRAGTAQLNATGTAPLDPIELEQQAIAKEEDEFLKLESIFISELGLDLSSLPSFAASNIATGAATVTSTNTSSK